MPADWPLTQLTLPGDARLICDPYIKNYSSKKVDGEWDVFFDSKSDWPALIEHVETCLRPLAFSEYYKEDSARGTDTRGVKRTYFSKDGITMVVLLDCRGARGSGVNGGDCDYTMKVMVYKAMADELASYAAQQQAVVKPVLRPL